MGLACLAVVILWRNWRQREAGLLQTQMANQRLQTVLRNVPAGLAIVDAENSVLLVNDRMSEVFQHDCTRLVRQSALALFGSVEQYQDLLHQAELAFALGEAFVTECPVRRANGSVFWARVSGRRVQHNEDIWEVVWICEDISERKAQEQMLAQQEVRMRMLIEAASDWIWEADRVGTYTYCSPRVRDVLGLEPDDVLGCSVFGFVDLDQARILENLFARGRDGAIPDPMTLVIRRTRNGEAQVMESALSPITDQRGVFQGFRGIDRDITARYRIERELKSKTAELSQSNAELEAFAYVASHDLREPLRMVSSYVALLERRYAGLLDEEGLSYIHFARDGAQRLDRLILDLLEYSRVGRQSHPAEPVPLADVVQDAVANLQASVDENHGSIIVDDGLPIIRGHRLELMRLMQNLIGNALKYHHPQRPPLVHVSVERRSDDWLVSVTDNGIGIKSDDLERVFGIFQRLHTRDEYPGTGIGLAVCRKIVEHHHGSIWAENGPDIGSRFCFTLPNA